jgi:hypothetical protein
VKEGRHRISMYGRLLSATSGAHTVHGVLRRVRRHRLLALAGDRRALVAEASAEAGRRVRERDDLYHYMIQPLVELYGGFMVVLKVS